MHSEANSATAPAIVASGSLHLKGHIPGLDVLRGLAILIVVLFHGIYTRDSLPAFHGLGFGLFYVASLGSSGVTLFYVLSGFLITGIIVDGSANPNFYRQFYLRRAARILPAYLLLITVLKLTHTVSWNFVLAGLLFIGNMARLVGARDYEYGPMWSLAVEEQFYLLWPWCVRRCSAPTLVRAIPIFCGVLFCLLALVAVYAPKIDIEYKLWGNAPWLMAGAWVAIALRTNTLHADNIRSLIVGLLIAAAITFPIVPYIDLFRHQTVALPFYRLPFALLYMAMLLIAIRNRRSPVTSTWRRCLAFLGYISYGLYLIHQFVQDNFDRLAIHTWLGRQQHNMPGLLISCAIFSTASIAIAYLMRVHFESLFLDRRAPARAVNELGPPAA